MRKTAQIEAVIKRLEKVVRLHPDLMVDFNRAAKKTVTALRFHAYQVETDKLHQREAIVDKRIKVWANEAVEEILKEKFSKLVREALRDYVDAGVDEQKSRLKIGE